MVGYLFAPTLKWTVTLDPNIYYKSYPTFEQLQQSDVWSLGVTMLMQSFGYRTFFSNILGNPKNIDELMTLYKKDKSISDSVQSYFKKSDDEILRENPGMTVEQLNGMRAFIKTDEYKIISREMLPVDPDLRSDIDDIVAMFSASSS